MTQTTGATPVKKRVAGRIPVGIAIEVENLSKSFGSSLIWEDVTLTIPAGEVSVILGP